MRRWQDAELYVADISMWLANNIAIVPIVATGMEARECSSNEIDDV